ncbi:hypothetical protein [Streptomyces sp. NPDC087437]|uniref:hypothetical protein n=1 Tax=Streptomyces sp. NPDC087437 TaxID=3365789 RepID=UPI00381BE3E5
MSSTAELIGAAAALLGLGFLTLRSVRSITRRRPFEAGWDAAHGGGVKDVAGGCPPRTGHV